ncbi:MAG: flagellar basal body-associated FliL family protein [Solirubrobacteraceae bacterium]|nr:flagellar basal body-associated FliL family protein [Solirubrobacteraceae bacterium]
MKPKLILPVVILIVGLFAGKTFFAKAPAAAAPKPKVHGEVYIMPKDFLINLKDGRFAKLNVGLILKHHYLAEAVAEASGGGHGAPKSPDGYGSLPQEALVRDIVTDALTGADATELISKSKRKLLKEEIVEHIKSHTDVKVEELIFTDVAVQ